MKSINIMTQPYVEDYIPVEKSIYGGKNRDNLKSLTESKSFILFDTPCP